MRHRLARTLFTWLPALLLAGISAISAGTAGADALRFTSVEPVGPGEWLVGIAGGKSVDQLAFRVDGTAVSAAVAAVEGAGRVRLKGVPAGAKRLEVLPAGGKTAAAAIRLAPLAPAEAPFADWTIYQIVVDMFKNGNPGNDGAGITGWKHPHYAGGDLQGVLDEADYLKGLGVNAVWLSPVFAARSSHGYDVTNYYRISEALGVPGDPKASQALFDRVVQALHERGLRVILDIPLNHAAAAYQRPAGDPENLHPRATGPRQEAEKLWDSWGSGYKYWDFDHAPTRKFLTDVALHWLRDEQVDGLRLDYVRGVPHDFWAELYTEVKKAKPGAYLVGECWVDSQGEEGNEKEIATYYEKVGGGPQFDSLLDFPLQMVMTDVFARGDSAVDLETWLESEEAVYGPGADPTSFLDNHDLSRFLAWTDSTERLVAAVGFLSALSGPEVLLYGTDAGLSHGGPKPGFTDVGRIPMDWKGGNPELRKKITAILAARREHPALTRGGRLPLKVEKDLLVMAKTGPGETALVGVNLSGQAKEVEVDLGALVPADTKWMPVLGDAPVIPGGGPGRLRWKLPPFGTSIVAARQRAAGAGP